MSACSDRRNAATLVEILIAAFILALAFIPLLGLVDFGSVSTIKMGNMAKATRLAQELLEECKHVPFKLYENEYPGLAEDTEEVVNPEFYKKTKENIEAFKKEGETKGNLKDFLYEAKFKFKKNSINQISEIWFTVEINWVDKGSSEGVSKDQQRRVKVATAYSNTEII